MDQMIPANRQPVAIASDHPYVQVGPRDLQTGRKRRRTPMNRMEAVSVHVVRKPARTSDSRNENNILGQDPELGHGLLDRGQNCIVAASGAPANFLVSNEILASQCASHFRSALQGSVDAIYDLADFERTPLDFVESEGVDQIVGAHHL